VNTVLSRVFTKAARPMPVAGDDRGPEAAGVADPGISQAVLMTRKHRAKGSQ
jgi:hypothetical protein